MARIDRQSFHDAKTISETFLPQASVRIQVLEFLADSIEYAHGVSNSNWNLNLDKDSDFIRLNVGRCYALARISHPSPRKRRSFHGWLS